MPKFTIISDINADIPFHVHRAGCADIARAKAKSFTAHAWTVEAPNAETAIGRELAELHANDQGYGISDFRILPCCKRA